MIARAVVVIAFVGLHCQAYAQLPPAPPPPPPPRDAQALQGQTTGTATLSGRVTNAESGKPLRRAQVRAIAPEMREGRTVSTDADGQWQMRRMPAGRYNITISKGGYVALVYGQRRPHEQGKPVEVTSGQVVEKLDVSLPKGSVITGRIIDEFGDPLAGVRVSAGRYRFIGGQRRLVNTSAGSTDSTDDIGQYRLHGLPPGDYYVSATFGSSFSFEDSDDRTGYAKTYFPGVPNVTEAQRVTVAEGQEAGGVGFALAPIRVARVSGTVTMSDGRPMANGMVRLMSAAPQTSMPSGNMGIVKPDGTFTIANVAPGDYTLNTQTAADMEAIATTGSTGAVRSSETASVPIIVTGADVTGLALVTGPTATARGRILFDSGLPADARAAAVMVITLPASPDSMIMMGIQARARDDWSFDLGGLSGKRLIRATPPAGWFVKSVTLNGTDVTDTPIDFKPAENLTGLEVTFTKRMASLTGAVQSARGQPTSDFVIVAFPLEAAGWGYGTRLVRTARPDQAGTFLITGLPVGDYLVAALEYLEPGDESDPEVLERLRAQATSISVGEGESKALTLKIK